MANNLNPSNATEEDILTDIQEALMSIQEAASYVSKIRQRLTKKVKTRKSYGRTLSCDIYSPINIPYYRSSIMDGYAITLFDTTQASWLPHTYPDYIDFYYTPKYLKPELMVYNFIPISTGNRVPDEYFAVVPMEDCVFNKLKNKVSIKISILETYRHNKNIRAIGSDIEEGTILAKKNTLITASHIGVFQSVGIGYVNTYDPLRVAIISTGDELRKTKNKEINILSDDQIFDSNTDMLKNLMKELDVKVLIKQILTDDASLINEKLNYIITNLTPDIVITNGGSSVGTKDFLRTYFENNCNILFKKLNLKPGKPTIFGIHKSFPCLFFGLPGNPVSAYVTFLLLIQPTIKAWIYSHPFNLPSQFPPALKVRVISNLQPDRSRPEWKRCTISYVTSSQYKLITSVLNHSTQVSEMNLLPIEDQSKVKDQLLQNKAHQESEKTVLNLSDEIDLRMKNIFENQQDLDKNSGEPEILQINNSYTQKSIKFFEAMFQEGIYIATVVKNQISSSLMSCVGSNGLILIPPSEHSIGPFQDQFAYVFGDIKRLDDEEIKSLSKEVTSIKPAFNFINSKPPHLFYPEKHAHKFTKSKLISKAKSISKNELLDSNEPKHSVPKDNLIDLNNQLHPESPTTLKIDKGRTKKASIFKSPLDQHLRSNSELSDSILSSSSQINSDSDWSKNPNYSTHKCKKRILVSENTSSELSNFLESDSKSPKESKKNHSKSSKNLTSQSNNERDTKSTFRPKISDTQALNNSSDSKPYFKEESHPNQGLNFHSKVLIEFEQNRTKLSNQNTSLKVPKSQETSSDSKANTSLNERSSILKHFSQDGKDSNNQPLNLSYRILTVSDSFLNDDFLDTTGQYINNQLNSLLKDFIWPNPNANIFYCKDEIMEIESAVKDFIFEKTSLIMINGGTGPSKRDVTPEAVIPLLTKRLTSLEIAISTNGLISTPLASLSRIVCGILENSVIICLPGSTNAAKDAFKVLQHNLIHLLSLVNK